MLIALVAIWVVAIPATVVIGAWALAVRRERRARRQIRFSANRGAGLHVRPLGARRTLGAARARRGCESSGRPVRVRFRGVWPS